MTYIESVVLERTLAALDAAGVPEELSSIAFERVFDLVSRDVLGVSPDEPSGQPSDQGGGVQFRGHEGEEDGLSRIAAQLKLERQLVEEVYGLKGDELELHPPATYLDKSRAGGTKEIALVVAAGRQAAGLEERTPHAEIRKWCDHYGRLDSSNFATTLGDMDSFFRTTGSPRKREVQLRHAGWEAAARVVRKLVSGPEL